MSHQPILRYTMFSIYLIYVWLCLCLIIISVTTFVNSAPTAEANVVNPDEALVQMTFASSPGAQRLLTNLNIAYELTNSLVTISTVAQAPDIIVQSVATLAVDAGVVTQGLTAAQSAVNPTFSLFPFLASAIVPTYRLDALGQDSGTLVFSRTTLAHIYAGYITYWDDPQIRADNPAERLPHQTITVITQNSSNAINAMFMSALVSFDPSLSQILGAVSAAPNWPYSSYANYLPATGATGVSAAVISNDGSIGYDVLWTANSVNVNVADMINKANRTVTANSDSVNFALIELATQTIGSDTDTLDLIDPSGTSAWPITFATYFLIDLQNTEGTCKAREALVEYMLWIYQSSVVAGIIADIKAAGISGIVMSQLDIINRITSSIYCRGNPALPTGQSAILRWSGTVHTSLVSSLLVNFYGSVDNTVKWHYQENSAQLALDQLITGEVDIATFCPDEVDADEYAAVLASGAFLVIPTALTAIDWMYNPQLAPRVNLAAYSNKVVLDMNTIGLL